MWQAEIDRGIIYYGYTLAGATSYRRRCDNANNSAIAQLFQYFSTESSQSQSDFLLGHAVLSVPYVTSHEHRKPAGSTSLLIVSRVLFFRDASRIRETSFACVSHLLRGGVNFTNVGYSPNGHAAAPYAKSSPSFDEFPRARAFVFTLR